MGVNRDKPDSWKDDISKSVDFYNDWFMEFAPKAFRETRVNTTKQVEDALQWTKNLTDVRLDLLRAQPAVLPILRMSTCPPIARDRLTGLAGVSKNLVLKMDRDGEIPPRMKTADLLCDLEKIENIIEKMADPDIFVWLERKDEQGTEEEIHRAATIVADRLCGAVADPIIRNAQEHRQLAAMRKWLEVKGYRILQPGEANSFEDMPAGTFSFRSNVPVYLDDEKKVNIPVDAVIMPKNAASGSFPVLMEAKSAGDFTNVNKRRKEEAVKMSQLQKTYGDKITFNLFLCGYFDSGYLGYEAAVRN